MLNALQFANNPDYHKSLWRMGGGYYRPDFLNKLLDPNHFCPGYQHLDRNPKFGPTNEGINGSDPVEPNPIDPTLTSDDSGSGNENPIPKSVSGGDEDRLFMVAKGLATLHPNLISIIQADPLPPFQPPPEDGLPYHLQDHN